MKPKIYRIIDANLNRLREGLRVIEEVGRFILNNKDLTRQIKNFRGELQKTVDQLPIKVTNLLEARQADRDVGRDLYPKTEARRSSITQIVTSNLKRCEEALRVLEEFSKMLSPSFGKHFKDLRFKLYTLEKQITLYLTKSKKLDFDLYVITDPGLGRSHLEIARQAIAGGAKIIQLRDKTTSKTQYYKWAREIRKITTKAGVTFIVNDYLDVCQAVEADGVHLGQDDLPVKAAREILGEGKIIGVSAYSLKQALKAEKDGADYVGVGPIFETPLKPGAKPLGITLLSRIIKKVKIPVVAIGGINESNLKDVLRAGTRRVAVIRVVDGAKNIPQAVRGLRRLIARAPVYR